MRSETPSARPEADSLRLLKLYAQLKGVTLDTSQLASHLEVKQLRGAAAWLRALNELGFNARRQQLPGKRRLARLPLPVLIEDRKSDEILLDKIENDMALIQRAQGQAPECIGVAELLALSIIMRSARRAQAQRACPANRRTLASACVDSSTRSRNTVALWARCCSPRSSCRCSCW